MFDGTAVAPADSAPRFSVLGPHNRRVQEAFSLELFRYCGAQVLNLDQALADENDLGNIGDTRYPRITPREEVLAQAMRKLERQLGREIHYTVLTPKEFQSRRARKDAFLEDVWHNKRVLLIGADEEAKNTRR